MIFKFGACNGDLRATQLGQRVLCVVDNSAESGHLCSFVPRQHEGTFFERNCPRLGEPTCDPAAIGRHRIFPRSPSECLRRSPVSLCCFEAFGASWATCIARSFLVRATCRRCTAVSPTLTLAPVLSDIIEGSSFPALFAVCPSGYFLCAPPTSLFASPSSVALASASELTVRRIESLSRLRGLVLSGAGGQFG